MNRISTYAQLVRLPNLPSALANICLGGLAVQDPRDLGDLPSRVLPFVLLLLASACLYCSGMVWNDFFDREQDRRERPHRPIPSGKVSPSEAARLGAILLAAGVVFAGLAGWILALREDGGNPRLPVVFSVALVVAILLYDGPMKLTWAGPIVMGLCRGLNVLLGVSVWGAVTWLSAHLALVVGLYVAGVTWFARTEARLSNRNALIAAASVMLVALLAALPLPVAVNPGTSSLLFPYLLVVFGFAVGFPLWQAIQSPTPSNVQAAVKRSLMGLIVLDAILASAVVGSVGFVILVLLAPAVYLNRRRFLYAT
jgi:4-hydroxybenzoate polyprenyltransferase